MKSYASLTMLKRRMSITSTASDDDLALALVTATRLIDIYIGDLDVAADDDWTGSATDISVATTPTSALVMATLALAPRVYKSPDVPFGVAGMNDQGIVAYVRSIAPEVPLILAGQVTSWGVA